MPMDNVTLENTQQSISSRDAKSVASVMVNGKWVNLSDTLEQANVKSDVGTVAKQVAAQQEVVSNAASTADSAVAYANDAIEKSRVNSQAIVAQSEAISEAKSAIDSATAEIQQAVANAASDAANIRADVAQVQNEVDTAKAANSASVEALKSDVSATKQDLADVHDSLTKAQAAAEDSQKAIDKSIAQINSDIEQDRKDIASAQQANADTAKQLDAYSKQAQDQGKTIKSIQDKQDGFTATLADVQGNVTQVSDKVGGLSASLKDAQDNVASVKAQADQLSATLTDHTKSISTLTASAKELSSTLEDADGRLSKVEQTAQTNSSTLSDVQGDLSQVKQDATTLTSTLKDAQGNISTLQQKADSVSDQLTSAQGDIASLQTDVKGIKATLVSHDGDIHTLQADSKTLKDNMQDVQGNISTLQKTSTDVTSELQDHAGRISKVEQTASTLNNEFSDQDGRLSKVEQTATGTQQTVANQQGQINSIQTDVSGIHETITGQGNQITTINATLNGLDTKYEGVSGDLGKLKDQNDWKTVTGAFDANQYTNTARIFYQDTNAKNTPNAGWFYLIVDAPSTSRITQKLIRDNTTDTWTRVYNGSWQAWTKGATQTDVTALSGQITTNSTQITQNKQAIALKADQTEVDQVKQTATQNSSRLDVMDGKISSKVTSKDVNNIVDSKGFATTNTVQSLITQKADDWNVNLTKLKNDTQTSLTNLAIGVEGVQAQVYNSDGSSKITQLSNVVQSKVSQGDYNSQINQLKNDINLRVQKGDMISQINQEAGGNTLIQVSNGNGSLILDAANTIVKGKEWIPVAAIADLTADQVQAGTLKGVKVDFRDSTGTGMIADGSTLTFDVSNTPAGYLSYNGMPVAELPDGSGGNELAIRYGLSTAIIPDDNSGAQATFSKAAQKIAYMTGTSRGKKMLSGLEVHSNNHHWLCAVNSDATCNRFEVNDHDGLNIAWHDNTHFFISDGNAKLYKDNDDSPTATKLEVHGWAWVNGWVEAAGHSQHSALSTKTDIQAIDDDEMLAMVNNTDLASFLFKTDVASGETHRHIGLIIDDVHDVAQYQAPQDFIAPNGVSRDDDNMIGALFGAVKALTKRIKTLESKVG